MISEEHHLFKQFMMAEIDKDFAAALSLIEEALASLREEEDEPTKQERLSRFEKYRVEALVNVGRSEEAKQLLDSIIDRNRPGSLYLGARTYLDVLSNPAEANRLADKAWSVYQRNPIPDYDEFPQDIWWAKADALDRLGKDDTEFYGLWEVISAAEWLTLEPSTMPLLRKWIGQKRFRQELRIVLIRLVHQFDGVDESRAPKLHQLKDLLSVIEAG